MILIKFLHHIFFVMVFVIICTSFATAQNRSSVSYEDSSFHQTSKDSAKYYILHEKKDSLYIASVYYIKTNQLKNKTIVPDTFCVNRNSLMFRYYANGILDDSIYRNKTGVIINAFHFYENGRLFVHYYLNEESNDATTDAFDTSGEKIDNFIYTRNAEFPGGMSAWNDFLKREIRSRIPAKNGAPRGIYSVIVRFIIDSQGMVSNIKSETNFGYGMEEEAMRAIAKSRKWISAMYLGKGINAYRRQPITFSGE